MISKKICAIEEDVITFTLPYPPTINHYYGNRGNGGKYIKQKGQAFRRDVMHLVIAERKADMLEKDICVKLDIFPPDNRKRDIDNINKALLDALTHASVYKDDRQIKDLHSVMHGFDGEGRVIVKISEV